MVAYQIRMIGNIGLLAGALRIKRAAGVEATIERTHACRDRMSTEDVVAGPELSNSSEAKS